VELRTREACEEKNQERNWNERASTVWAYVFSNAPVALLVEGGVFLTLAVSIHLVRRARRPGRHE
jgi:hypothetical protein